MKCFQIQQRVNELLDQRLDPLQDPVLAAHCEACESCSVYVNDFSLFSSSELFSTNSSVRAEPHIVGDSMARHLKATMAFWASAAAILFCGFVATFFLNPSPQTALQNKKSTPMVANVDAVSPVNEDVDVAEILDISTLIESIDLTSIDARKIPVVRPLVHSVDNSIDGFYAILPDEEMQNDQLKKAREDRQQVQSFLNSVAKLF